MNETKEAQVQEIKSPVAVRAEQIQKLLEEGRSLEEALQITAPMERVIGNRVEYIKGLNTLAEVRKAGHSAHGKLSKARQSGNQTTIDRYKAELEAAKERFNYLSARINTAEDPLKAAIAMGESPSQIAQQLVILIENELKSTLEKVQANLGWTKAELKSHINRQPVDTPKEITERLLLAGAQVRDLFETRLIGGDKRVETVNRRMNLYLELEAKAKALVAEREKAAAEKAAAEKEVKLEKTK